MDLSCISTLLQIFAGRIRILHDSRSRNSNFEHEEQNITTHYEHKTSYIKNTQNKKTNLNNMATSQQVRAQTKQGQWSSIFPNEQVTEAQSTLFVKKLLAVAVSSISYLRALFPENAFGDRCLEDVNLKILRDDSTCPEACRVIQWIKGCFDALEKKYLRAVLVGIYEDPEDPDTAIEQYSFKFSYGDGGGVDVYRNGAKITTAKSDKETKKATIRLLRTIVLLSQTLSPLPDDVMMTMKLLYYDEVTPEDYNPPGFKDCDCDDFTFKDEPINIKVGDVATQFHSFKLRIKTQNHDLQENENEEEDIAEEVEEEAMVPDESIIKNNDESKSLYNIKVLDEKEEIKENNDPQVETQGLEDVDITVNIEDDVPKQIKQCNTRVSTPASSVVPDDELNVMTKCPCGVDEDDGLMILCASCNTWQHATCFAILNPEDAPEIHYCVECAQNSTEFQCTDQYLAKIDDTNKIRADCLWRRALLSILETTRILAPNLSKRLGVPLTVATSLLKRLETEGFVKSGGKAKRFGKLVQKEVIKERGLDRYFRHIENEQNEELIIMTEKASNMQIASSKRDKGKGSKRKSVGEVVSAHNRDLRFEISDSQTSQTSPLRKRKKTSVSAEAMCV